jgi:hypothetical protein
MQPDGTRTHPKFDEARILSEMARYITHKEQPISMGGCMSFAPVDHSGVRSTNVQEDPS